MSTVMDYRTLGASGCAVSAFALGTMTFGKETDEKGSFAQLDRFVEAGGTLVDTADVYAGGDSETIIGQWFADRPSDVTDRVVLATKGRFPIGDNPPNGAGLSTRHLTRALDASLRRLGLDHVDLYQVHAFDPLTPLEETLRTLDGFVQAGKIRYYGLSNFTGWQLTKAVRLARAAGPARSGDPAAAVQPAGPRDRVRDRAGRPRRRPRPAALVAARWWLAVRQVQAGRAADRRDPARARTRSGAWRPTTSATQQEHTWNVIEAVQSVAEQRGVSMAQVALAWVTDRPVGHLDDPRRPHAGAARGQPGRRGPAPHFRRVRDPRRSKRSAAARLPVRADGRRPAQPRPGRRTALTVTG